MQALGDEARIVDGKLAYVNERATTEHPLRPYASALLVRRMEYRLRLPR